MISVAARVPLVCEGIVIQSEMSMSPFRRDLGSHQMRQRLSLDTGSLIRQGGSIKLTIDPSWDTQA